MDNSNASSGSQARAGLSTAANDEVRPIIYQGVIIGYARRPVIRCNDAGYERLLRDFREGRSIEEQVARIQERRN
ncbi:uncharacterized protein EAF01_008987 [Botrytis porri]|uniref:Uncharacterized protein n=1 Tax=Botrytis porri TaxID=87229 RepID=A0A4Z1L063_9HELO|nr:uncharacterized protein EAF01_008987 [Botrytis porri]KAF7898021.1 hypothetical protein EAF01_008987 [Botrytis porri]TGO90235.1 hypothetical protein BPOR_0073g00100 [Botrytis porri]